MLYQHILQSFVPFSLTGKTVTLKNVTSTSKKRAAQNVGGSSRKGKANPATVTLANYFKMKAKADHLHLGGLSPSEKPDGKTSGSPSPASDQTVPQNKKTATSLILFEEVNHLATPRCETYNLMDMRPHVTPVCPGLIHLQTVCSHRLMSYLMMMLVSSQPSRLSWQPLKDRSF